MESCKFDEILTANIAALKMLVHVADPILSIKRLVTGSESLRLISQELTQISKLIATMLEIALMLVTPLLQQL